MNGSPVSRSKNSFRPLMVRMPIRCCAGGGDVGSITVEVDAGDVGNPPWDAGGRDGVAWQPATRIATRNGFRLCRAAMTTLRPDSTLPQHENLGTVSPIREIASGPRHS